MWDLLLDLIQVNEGVNYTFILSVIFAYVFFMWFVVSVWVLSDARKRYSSLATACLLALFVLLGMIPALIIYILIRPEHTLEEDYYINLALSGEKEMKPIYFDGNKGFDISFNISVQPKERDGDYHKMMMDVAWMPQKKEEIKPQVHKENMYFENLTTGIRNAWKKFSSSVSNSVSDVKRKARENAKKRSEAKEAKSKNHEDKKEISGKKEEKKDNKKKDKQKQKKSNSQQNVNKGGNKGQNQNRQNHNNHGSHKKNKKGKKN